MSHPHFTVEDKPFVLAILSNPAELTAWLVYADWLDEHANYDYAEYLRLMAHHGQLHNTDPAWHATEERLQELRARLDPNWVIVFDRPKIEKCELAFRFQCPQKWENLKITSDPTIRHCAACDKKVHYCRALPEAQDHAQQGHCVAVQLGVLRYPDDLSDRRPSIAAGELLMGIINAHNNQPTPDPPRRPWWKFW